MTARSDSDQIRVIRAEAAEMCHKKNHRIWWSIGLIVSVLMGAIGAGAGIAWTDHGTLQAHGEKFKAVDDRFKAVDDRFDRLDPWLLRIEDKLDMILSRRNAGQP